MERRTLRTCKASSITPLAIIRVENIVIFLHTLPLTWTQTTQTFDDGCREKVYELCNSPSLVEGETREIFRRGELSRSPIDDTQDGEAIYFHLVCMRGEAGETESKASWLRERR